MAESIGDRNALPGQGDADVRGLQRFIIYMKRFGKGRVGQVFFLFEGHRVILFARFSSSTIFSHGLPLFVEPLREAAFGQKLLLQLLQLSSQEETCLVDQADERVRSVF